MDIGIFCENSRTGRGQADLEAYIAMVAGVAERGFTSAWSPQVGGLDALTGLALAAREAPGIRLGTSVVPVYVHHPIALAQQALTVDIALQGRLVLGIGLSHQWVVENFWGLSFEKPARYMREYLDVLLPVLRDGNVAVKGEVVSGTSQLSIPEGTNVPVLIAALAPIMLGLAGRVADGTITWMTGPKTIESHVAPSINAAAKDAGRSAPEIIVGLPTCITDDPDAAREKAATQFSVYGMLPSYRAMLDREGAAGPADVAIVGDEATVRGQIEAIAAAGATEFCAAPFGDVERTLDGLASIKEVVR